MSMRLQFRSPVDERGQLRSQVEALEKERHVLSAEVKRLQESQDCCESREARWRSQQKELESKLEAMYHEIKARRAEAAAVRDEVQRLNNALDLSNSSLKDAEAKANTAAKCLEETAAQHHLAESKVQQLTAEVEELWASAKHATRRAQRCDAAEAERAELQQQLQRELMRRSEEIAWEQKFQAAQKRAEESTEHAINRAEFAEQKARDAEKQVISLETQVAQKNTALENSTTSLRVAEAEKQRFREEAVTAKERVADIIDQLSVCEAEKSSLEKNVEDCLQLRNKLKDVASKAVQKEQRCQELLKQIATLEAKQETFMTQEREIQDQRAEIHCLKEREKGLQENFITVQKEIAAAAAALRMSEERIAPLEAEASRCREEAKQADLEAQQRRLEAEATRMAHYEQDRDVQHLRERVIAQGEELKRLQTLLAMGDVDVVAATPIAASPYIGPRRIQKMLSGLEDITPRGARPQLPPTGKRIGMHERRPSTPREARSFSKSSRTPSASTRVPDDDDRF